MKKFSVITIFFCIGIICTMHAQHIEVSGDIASDSTWDADTVKVTEDVTILDNVTLRIMPGTVISFQGRYELIVEGRLLAEGTSTDTIYFTADTIHSGWCGIQFLEQQNEENNSILNYCKIEYVNEHPVNFRNYALYIRQNSYVEISNCNITKIFRMVGEAIYCYKSDITIKNSSISHNECSGFEIVDSYVTIDNSFICNNGVNGIYFNNSNAVLNNCIINNNYNYEPVISRGLLLKNSDIIVNNCLIVNNNWGIDIERSSPVFNNCIIRGNSGLQILLSDYSSIPEIYNCNIQDGLPGIVITGGAGFNGIYKDNIDTDPLFINPTSDFGIDYDALVADWHIPFNSPCVNTGRYDPGLEYPGHDMEGNKRIHHGIIDMGVYEFHQDSLTVGGTINTEEFWIADTIRVTSDILLTGKLTIAPGSVVEFQRHYFMDIEWGTLSAVGTESAMIQFTVNDTSGHYDKSSNLGGWAGMEFSGGDTSRLSYCILENIKKIGFPRTNGAVKIMSAPVILTDNLIRYNFVEEGASAIYADHSNTQIIDNEICYNECWGWRGGAIFTYNAGLPLIRGNYIHHNKDDGHGGGIFCTNEATIVNNIVSFNEASNGGGIYIWMSEPVVKDNIISNNKGHGIYISSSGDPLIINNIICNNTSWRDAGIYVSSDTKPVFINNTICNNLSESSSGYGITVDERCTATFINNIIWGNDNGSGSSDQIRLLGENFSILRNCLIQHGQNGIAKYRFDGIMEDILDSIPYFDNPTERAGIDYHGLHANWSLLSVSPAIDAGWEDTASYTILHHDFNGNFRINNHRIDLGAIENQLVKPEITQQPYSLIKCAGENAEFRFNLSDTAFYIWKKDGVVISGEKSPEFIIDSVRIADQGNYSCLAWNAYDSLVSNTVTLIVNENPEFLVEPPDRWVVKGSKFIQNVWAKGSNPDFRWQVDEEDIDGAKSPELVINNVNYENEATYRCIISNSCGTDTTPSFNLFIAPELCMVTVDPATGNNLVIWEKSSKAPIDRYNIYRESQAAGIYDLLGTVAQDELSILVDPTADPTVQAYLYKITAVDTSGYETDIDLCEPHKTIHLLVSTNPELNTTQLEWDKYYGFEYSTYNILRSATGTGFAPVHFLASSLASWTDPDPLPETGYYRISVDKPEPCIPAGAGKKADAGPYSHSLSNVEDNRLQAGESPPDTIILTHDNLDENNMYGALVGRLQTIDADTLDAHLYTLVSGQGSDDNFSFTILGDMLLAAEMFDYETKDVYTIRVRCTDKGNLSREEVFTIFINDVLETGITATAIQKPRIYPNPFTQSTTIKFPNPDKEKYRMYITDVAGKVVRFEDNIFTGKLEISRDNLPAGIYFVEINGDKIYRGKLVIE